VQILAHLLGDGPDLLYSKLVLALLRRYLSRLLHQAAPLPVRGVHCSELGVGLPDFGFSTVAGLDERGELVLSMPAKKGHVHGLF